MRKRRRNFFSVPAALFFVCCEEKQRLRLKLSLIHISWLKFDLNIVLTEIAFHVSWIVSTNMYIAKEIVLVNALHSLCLLYTSRCV